MRLREMVLERLRSHVARITDLAESLSEDTFAARLPAPSSTIGAQMWCVVGARESYSRALVEGGWSGFACSLDYDQRHDRASVIGKLTESADSVERVLVGLQWDDPRDDLIVELLEHEAQHQGQLIRYLYGLGLPIPASWADRWALG